MLWFWVVTHFVGDNSHFSPPDISDEKARFTTYEGYDYSVSIIGTENDCIPDSYDDNEDDETTEDDAALSGDVDGDPNFEMPASESEQQEQDQEYNWNDEQ